GSRPRPRERAPSAVRPTSGACVPLSGSQRAPRRSNRHRMHVAVRASIERGRGTTRAGGTTVDKSSSRAEAIRLDEDAQRVRNWKRWGPYLSERQWGTVREDYSEHGTAWDYFPHDHARSRTYRWGEDGLLGICDRECRLCFAVALWNGRDPILK